MSIMEQVHETYKASKFEPQDFISGMPDNVITNILDRLPIQDAVKTDVLSKNWNFKWTLLTHLKFDEDFFRYLPEKFDGKIISRLLLHLKGPVAKFTLYIPEDDILDLEDIKHWVLFLSRRGIKEVTLECYDHFVLPTQLRSCVELKHLELRYVCIPSLPGFHGFPNLLSLHLDSVDFQMTLGEFISRCPLLEILSNSVLYDTCESELIEVCKLANLKKLSWSVCMESGPSIMIKSSSFYQLTALAKLQELNLDFGCCKFMAVAGVDKKVPAAFLCLNTLILSGVNLGCDIMASFVLKMICNSPNLHTLDITVNRVHQSNYCNCTRSCGVDKKKVPTAFLCLNTLILSCINFGCDIMAFVLKMICNSPNLQTLNITGEFSFDVSPSAVCSLDLGCNTTEQLQLRSVVFSRFTGSENEVCLIKFLLASSPLLKKFVVSVDQYFVKEHAEFAWRMAGKLLNLHRASPIVEIDLC